MININLKFNQLESDQPELLWFESDQPELLWFESDQAELLWFESNLNCCGYYY